MENKLEIVNTIKMLLYKIDPKIYEKLDFNDDTIFMESLLFSYLNNKDANLFPNEILEEVLQGYYTKKEKLKIKYSFNKNDIAYIPEIGYFKKGKEKPYEEILKKGDFEVLKEVHPTQEKYFVEFYKGRIVNKNPEHNSVWEEHYEELFEAIEVLKKHLPGFYEQLVFANKKIYLHENAKTLNFTAI